MFYNNYIEKNYIDITCTEKINQNLPYCIYFKSCFSKIIIPILQKNTSSNRLKMQNSKWYATFFKSKEFAAFSLVSSISIKDSYFICANGEIKSCKFAAVLFKP